MGIDKLRVPMSPVMKGWTSSQAQSSKLYKILIAGTTEWLCARHSSKHIPCINTVSSQNNPKRNFVKEKTKSRIINLPKVTQLASITTKSQCRQFGHNAHTLNHFVLSGCPVWRLIPPG